MSEPLLWILRGVAAEPALEWVLGGAAFALLMSLGAHVALLWRRFRRSITVVLALAGVLGAGAIGAAGIFAQEARALVLDRAVRSADPGSAYLTGLGWLVVITGLALVLVPAWTGALARLARPTTRTLVTGAALLATVTTWVAAFYVLGLVDALSSTAEVAHGVRRTVIASALATLDVALAAGALILLAIGLATAVLTLRWRAEPIFSNRGRVLSVVVFLAGLAAFLATRDHAWDRRHPQPLAGVVLGFHNRTAPVPGMTFPCSQYLEVAPELAVRDGQVRLDNRVVATPEQLDDSLARMRANWSMLHPREPFSHALILRADPDTSLASLRPHLERAFAAGYHRLFVDAVAEVPISTRTLGVVHVRRRCAVQAELIEGSEPLPATVGELVLQLQRGRGSLAIGTSAE